MVIDTFLAALFAALFAMGCWWFATGIILLLNRLPQRSFRWSLLGWSVLLVLSFWGVWTSMSENTVANAYLGFGSVIVMWGWHEMAFLTGTVTGPRRIRLDAHLSEWRRFQQSLNVILYHELVLIVNFVLLCLLQSGLPNHLAICTFGLLWCMRVSAKFNLYFGVPRTGAEYLPAHLQYLASYFRQKGVTLWFLISMGLSCGAWGWIISEAYRSQVEINTGWVLLATLLGLAIVEHAFMVLPVPMERIWAWALERNDARFKKTLPHTPSKATAP